jgi:uncharacterized membrane protein
LPISQGSASGTTGSFVVRPNRSLGKGGTLLVFAGICLIACLVAIRFWLLGAWVVLPITALELVFLGIAFLVVERKTRFCETIELTEQAVSVVQRDWKSEREWCYPTYWVQVIFREDPSGWYPSHLYLRSHGDTLEIGACLNDSERSQLSQDLKKIIDGVR